VAAVAAVATYEDVAAAAAVAAVAAAAAAAAAAAVALRLFASEGCAWSVHVATIRQADEDVAADVVDVVVVDVDVVVDVENAAAVFALHEAVVTRSAPSSPGLEATALLLQLAAD